MYIYIYIHMYVVLTEPAHLSRHAAQAVAAATGSPLAWRHA